MSTDNNKQIVPQQIVSALLPREERSFTKFLHETSIQNPSKALPNFDSGVARFLEMFQDWAQRNPASEPTLVIDYIKSMPDWMSSRLQFINTEKEIVQWNRVRFGREQLSIQAKNTPAELIHMTMENFQTHLSFYTQGFIEDYYNMNVDEKALENFNYRMRIVANNLLVAVQRQAVATLMTTPYFYGNPARNTAVGCMAETPDEYFRNRQVMFGALNKEELGIEKLVQQANFIFERESHVLTAFIMHDPDIKYLTSNSKMRKYYNFTGYRSTTASASTKTASGTLPPIDFYPIPTLAATNHNDMGEKIMRAPVQTGSLFKFINRTNDCKQANFRSKFQDIEVCDWVKNGWSTYTKPDAFSHDFHFYPMMKCTCSQTAAATKNGAHHEHGPGGQLNRPLLTEFYGNIGKAYSYINTRLNEENMRAVDTFSVYVKRRGQDGLPEHILYPAQFFGEMPESFNHEENLRPCYKSEGDVLFSCLTADEKNIFKKGLAWAKKSESLPVTMGEGVRLALEAKGVTRLNQEGLGEVYKCELNKYGAVSLLTERSIAAGVMINATYIPGHGNICAMMTLADDMTKYPNMFSDRLKTIVIGFVTVYKKVIAKALLMFGAKHAALSPQMVPVQHQTPQMDARCCSEVAAWYTIFMAYSPPLYTKTQSQGAGDAYSSRVTGTYTYGKRRPTLDQTLEAFRDFQESGGQTSQTIFSQQEEEEEEEEVRQTSTTQAYPDNKEGLVMNARMQLLNPLPRTKLSIEVRGNKGMIIGYNAKRNEILKITVMFDKNAKELDMMRLWALCPRFDEDMNLQLEKTESWELVQTNFKGDERNKLRIRRDFSYPEYAKFATKVDVTDAIDTQKKVTFQIMKRRKVGDEYEMETRYVVVVENVINFVDALVAFNKSPLLLEKGMTDDRGDEATIKINLENFTATVKPIKGETVELEMSAAGLEDLRTMARELYHLTESTEYKSPFTGSIYDLAPNLRESFKLGKINPRFSRYFLRSEDDGIDYHIMGYDRHNLEKLDLVIPKTFAMSDSLRIWHMFNPEEDTSKKLKAIVGKNYVRLETDGNVRTYKADFNYPVFLQLENIEIKKTNAEGDRLKNFEFICKSSVNAEKPDGVIYVLNCHDLIDAIFALHQMGELMTRDKLEFDNMKIVVNLADESALWASLDTPNELKPFTAARENIHKINQTYQDFEYIYDEYDLLNLRFTNREHLPPVSSVRKISVAEPTTQTTTTTRTKKDLPRTPSIQPTIAQIPQRNPIITKQDFPQPPTQPTFAQLPYGTTTTITQQDFPQQPFTPSISLAGAMPVERYQKIIASYEEQFRRNPPSSISDSSFAPYFIAAHELTAPIDGFSKGLLQEFDARARDVYRHLPVHIFLSGLLSRAHKTEELNENLISGLYTYEASNSTEAILITPFTSNFRDAAVITSTNLTGQSLDEVFRYGSVDEVQYMRHVQLHTILLEEEVRGADSFADKDVDIMRSFKHIYVPNTTTFGDETPYDSASVMFGDTLLTALPFVDSSFPCMMREGVDALTMFPKSLPQWVLDEVNLKTSGSKFTNGHPVFSTAESQLYEEAFDDGLYDEEAFNRYYKVYKDRLPLWAIHNMAYPAVQLADFVKRWICARAYNTFEEIGAKFYLLMTTCVQTFQSMYNHNVKIPQTALLMRNSEEQIMKAATACAEGSLGYLFWNQIKDFTSAQLEAKQFQMTRELHTGIAYINDKIHIFENVVGGEIRGGKGNGYITDILVEDIMKRSDSRPITTTKDPRFQKLLGGIGYGHLIQNKCIHVVIQGADSSVQPCPDNLDITGTWFSRAFANGMRNPAFFMQINDKPMYEGCAFLSYTFGLKDKRPLSRDFNLDKYTYYELLEAQYYNTWVHRTNIKHYDSEGKEHITCSTHPWGKQKPFLRNRETSQCNF